MAKINVSVIVPVYNEKKYISECLDSLLSQNFKSYEIIAVDDGSTDDSSSILKEFNKKVGNIRLLSQRHQGPAKARNKGAKQARGEILVFVDGDMYFHKNYLRDLVRPIVAGKAVATYTREEYVANQENVWSRCWSINSYLPEHLHIDPAISDTADTFRAIRKDIFYRTKGYLDIGYKEDVTVLAQLEKVNARVVGGAVCYHFNPSSLSEVFLSARWMGRGEISGDRLFRLLVHSFINSLRKGIQGIVRNGIPEFLIFIIVFDLGISIGIIERFLLKIHYK